MKAPSVFIIGAAVGVLFLAVIPAFGQNTMFTYQGRVLDNGTNFTGTGLFKFALVTSTNTSQQATATANPPSGGFITVINVTFGGSGYISAPGVSITGGGGSNATATAQISGSGVVTNITVNNPGSSYTSTPTVTVAPPPANIFYTTWWSNDGTSVNGSEPSAAVSVGVTNGLFTVVLGDTTLPNMTAVSTSLFTQPNLQLRIWFSDGLNGSVALSPVQNLTPTPYAIFADVAGTVFGVVPSSGLSGTYSGAVSFTNSGSSFAGNGNGLTNVNATTLDGLGTSSFWQNSGNSGTTPGTNFVGTADNQPLELHVNGQRALRLEPTPNISAVNLLGGSAANGVDAGVVGATIAGGGTTNYNGMNYPNHIGGSYGTIGGGADNRIAAGSTYTTIAGGGGNTIGAGLSGTIGGGVFNFILDNDCVIGGGYGNTIQAGQSSVIGGGNANTIQSFGYSFIGGGTQNSLDAPTAVIAGGFKNTIQSNAVSSCIGGGEQNSIQTNASDSTIAGGFFNTIQTNAPYATISGGYENTIDTNCNFSAIGGGWAHTIIAGSINSTIAGGFNNKASGAGVFIGGGGINGFGGNSATGDASTIGGGLNNTIESDSYAAILGGQQNTIVSNANYAFIGGGGGNYISGSYAMVPGGQQNTAAGTYSFAAGNRAKANAAGCFVWADSQSADFNSTTNDQFSVRAQGGVQYDPSTSLFFGTTTRQMLNLYAVPGAANNYAIGIQTGTLYNRCGSDVPGTGFAWYRGGSPTNSSFNAGGGATLMTLTVSGLTVNGTFVSSSDRNAKEHFQPIDPRETLAKLASLPITSWSFKLDPTTRHLGPMAQDFFASFNVGSDDKHIATVDEGGVALAAIQGLNQKVEADTAALRAENVELKARLEKLEKLILQSKPN